MIRKLVIAGLALALIVIVGGCAPQPATPGPIQFQGGTQTKDWYIGGAAADPTAYQGHGCNQQVRDQPNGGGNLLGVYVDDTVNSPESDPTIQERCVYYNHQQCPYCLVVAGISMGHPTWSMDPWGATYSAYEWYPHCHGLNDAFGVSWTLPHRNAYIVQWNFKWSAAETGDPNCTAPTQADHNQTYNDLNNSNGIVPIQAILYF